MNVVAELTALLTSYLGDPDLEFRSGKKAKQVKLFLYTIRRYMGEQM
jgi:hypothetical protein